VISTSDPVPDPFTEVDGLTFAAYVEICRELVRVAGGSARRTEEVLAGHDLNPVQWASLSAEWSERIRQHPLLRAEFRRLYAGPSGPDSTGNE
jgi:hypothetical protein